jgi:hypothetical protein
VLVTHSRLLLLLPPLPLLLLPPLPPLPLLLLQVDAYIREVLGMPPRELDAGAGVGGAAAGGAAAAAPSAEDDAAGGRQVRVQVRTLKGWGREAVQC